MGSKGSRGRRILKVISVSIAAMAILVGAVVGYCSWNWGRTVDAAKPPIHADRSAEAVARGAAIFHSTCEACHRGAGGERAMGAPLTEIPEFLGTFHSANLTSHPTAGIGALDDETIARVIRFGIDRDGKRIFMPTYGMGDADVAAVLGFLRSSDPLFASDATVPPRSKLSALGRTIFTLTGGSRLPARATQGIAVPPKAATIAYGRYLAHDVYDCVGCHTPGFAADKSTGPDAFTGGFEFRDPSGHSVVAKNLTPDETGIAHYSANDLRRALRQGARPDGTILSAPMPLFRGLEDVEIDALYNYLRSLQARPAEAGARTPKAAPVVSAHGPAERFRTLGCVGCHGRGAAHASALTRAVSKPAPELARWIRNPERTIPGTSMPTYAELLDEGAALELAEWIKSGGPQTLAER